MKDKDSPSVTTAKRVLRVGMEEKASRYRSCSKCPEKTVHGQPIRGRPLACELLEGLTFKKFNLL